MAFRTWGRLLLTALGVSVLAGAGQLGIAYGFGIVRLTGAFTGATVNQWPAQLVWVGWFAANAAVAGAVLTGRLARRDALPATTGRHLAVGAAAALGATAVAPLCMQPARAAELVSVDPVFAVGICAVLGAIVGAGAAIAVLLNPPLGWNVAAVAGTVWLLALVSALPSVGAGPLRAVRLGVLEPTWLASDAAQRLSLLLLPTIGLLAGAGSAALARWRGHVPLVSGATGVAGPVLVAFAYLTAGPGDAVNRYQTTPYYAALISVAAGALGAAAAALLRWPLRAHPHDAHAAGAHAIEPSAILRPLPAGPALPSGSADPARPSGPASAADDATADRVTTGGPRAADRSTTGRTPEVAGDPAPDTSTVQSVPAHWDWPASGGTPLTVESTLGSAIPSTPAAESAPTGDRPPTTGPAPATPASTSASATSAPRATRMDGAGPGDVPAGVAATDAQGGPADTDIGTSAMTERHNYAPQSSSSIPDAPPDETGRKRGRRSEDGARRGAAASSPAAPAGQAAEQTAAADETAAGRTAADRTAADASSAAAATGDGSLAESTAGPAEPQKGAAADTPAATTPKPRRTRKSRASAKPTVPPQTARDNAASPAAATVPSPAATETGNDRASDDHSAAGTDGPPDGPAGRAGGATDAPPAGAEAPGREEAPVTPTGHETSASRETPAADGTSASRETPTGDGASRPTDQPPVTAGPGDAPFGAVRQRAARPTEDGPWTDRTADPAPAGPAGPVPPAWPVPPRSAPTSYGPVGTGRTVEPSAAGDDPSGPVARGGVADQAGPAARDEEPLPRARHRAPLPDLNRATDWEALARARRAGPVSTTPRRTPPGHTASDASSAQVEDRPDGSADSPGTPSPQDPASPQDTASPQDRAAEQSAGRGRGRLGLFRRNRARSDGDTDPAEPEPLAEQDEEYVDWVAGLSRPLADNEPEQESGRRSLRSTGRHHRD